MNKKSKYNELVFHNDSGKWFLCNFFTGQSLILTRHEKEQYDLFPEKTLDSAFFDKLKKMGALVDFEEIEALRRNCFAEIQKDPDGIFLLICPTMDCNFACSYCSEGQTKHHGLMDSETVYALKRFFDRILDETRVSRVHVHWYGGEPLLGIQVINNLSRHFIFSASLRKVHYSAAITTNGYLLSEQNIEILCSCKVVSYRITIDGTEKNHDQIRVLPNGGKTFDRIMKNVRHLCQRKIVTEIRCNVSRQNVSGLSDLSTAIQKLEKDTGAPIQLHYARMMVYRGVDTSLNSIAMTSDEFSDFCRNVYDSKYEQIYPAKIPCVACHSGAYCIDEAGNIYCCNSWLGNSKHIIGNVKNLPSFSLLENSEECNWFRSHAFPENETCLSCKLLPGCMGSCPLSCEGEKRCHPYRNKTKDLALKMADREIKENS